MGTQSLADLEGGVTPDYIIPEGFIDTLLATLVSFVGADAIDLTGLPLDGVNSLNEGVGAAEATPTNFSGEIGVVPEPSSALAALSALASVALLARRPTRTPMG